jgi:hypothetical protein
MYDRPAYLRIQVCSALSAFVLGRLLLMIPVTPSAQLNL